MIRRADLHDLTTLVEIEKRCFDSDRLSRRNFRHLLTKGHAATLVITRQQVMLGYVMVLFNRGTSLARMYSIAVVPEARGQGLGQELIEAAEQTARDEGCVYMRLEVRRDNQASIELYKKLGYRLFGRHDDYYEDHMEALRFEKLLVPRLSPDITHVPHYQQTLEFTCGPAALLMAMHALDDSVELDRRHELRLWRESTTIFMTSGHGGCGPYGLALSAMHRGFGVEIFLNDEGALFIDSVRSEEKKEVIRLVQEDFLDEINAHGIPVHQTPLTLAEMKEHFEAGRIPVVLISSYRIYKEKFPHWVVVTGFDDRFIYVHDPYVDVDEGKTLMDCLDMPILQSDFERMARYGKSGLRAALIISKKETN